MSLYAYVNPMIAVVLGTLVLGEPFSARMGVAAAIVLAGMMLVRSSETQCESSIADADRLQIDVQSAI